MEGSWEGGPASSADAFPGPRAILSPMSSAVGKQQQEREEAARPARAIVFLHASDYCAGAERSLLEIVRGLKARGHRVEVWNAGENPELASWMEEAGVPLRPLPEPNYGTRDVLGFLRHGLVLLVRWLRRRPRLAHANSVTAAKYAAPFAALLRVPLICHWRNVPDLDGLTKLMLGRATSILAVSEYIAEAVGPVPGTPTRVVYNATDVFAVTPSPPPQAPDEPLRLVTPAAYRTDKRIDLILSVAARLRERGCSFHWRVCGPRPDPDYSASVEREHERLELRGCVSLEPSRSHEELFRDAQVVVSASVGEPFGRTVIEGHARALPVVGFRTGALPELIRDGETGFVVPDGDVEAMAQALARLEGDRGLVLEMGRAGRQDAERRFSLERLLDTLEEHYDEIA